MYLHGKENYLDKYAILLNKKDIINYNDGKPI